MRDIGKEDRKTGTGLSHPPWLSKYDDCNRLFGLPNSRYEKLMLKTEQLILLGLEILGRDDAHIPQLGQPL